MPRCQQQQARRLPAVLGWPYSRVGASPKRDASRLVGRALDSMSMWAGELGEIFPLGTRGEIALSYPLRRLGTPADIAAAVVFLTSDRAGYITGQTLSVSGGYTMA